MTELIPSGTSVAALHKARAEATPHKREPVEYTGDYYKTVVKNASDSDATLLDDIGGNWLVIPSGREIVLCSWSEKTMYAPFSKVVLEKGGKVSATRRFGFHDPAESEPWSIVLDNRDGAPMEVVRVLDDFVSVPRGIPRRVPITLLDSLIGYSRIVWKRKTIKEAHPSNRSYLITRVITEKIMVPRRSGELRAIKKEIEKKALAEARLKADQRFARISPVEVEDAETESQAE